MKQPKEEMRTVTTKGYLLRYLLTRKQVVNINLRIKPDSSICVSANSRVSASYIDDFVLSKADFIIAALDKYEKLSKNRPAPQQYINGESFLFLGEKLTIEVLKSESESVFMHDGKLFLHLLDPQNFSRKSTLVNSFIKSQCEEIFSEISKKVYTDFGKYNIPYPQIKIREMKSRWGSCQPKRGIITLNKKLLEFPLHCIEYVVLHEFCHFIHPNHSKEFYGFLQSLMPEWKSQKNLLRGVE